jgi:hypothetical protein
VTMGIVFAEGGGPAMIARIYGLFDPRDRTFVVENGDRWYFFHRPRKGQLVRNPIQPTLARRLIEESSRNEGSSVLPQPDDETT